MDHKWVNENYKNYKKKLIENPRRGKDNGHYNAAFLAFKAKKIKKALFSYFASILATPEDKDIFTEMFRAMDNDGDGFLTAEEFEKAMSTYLQFDPENVK